MKLGDLVEDAWKVCQNSAYTVGFALSFLGLEYIDEHIFGGSITPQIPPDTNIFSFNFALYAGQFICVGGTVIAGVSTAYSTLRIPVKLITGKYFKKK